MNIVKNAHYLKEVAISEDKIENLHQRADQYQLNEKVTFKILSSILQDIGYDKTGNQDTIRNITVEVRQGRNSIGKYLTSKELSNRAKSLFEQFVREPRKIEVKPVPYKIPPPDEVTPQWIQQLLNFHNMNLKQLEEDTGLNKTNLSAWINDKRPMSQPVKAMFYYYFQAKT